MFGLKTGKVGALGRIAGAQGRPAANISFLGGSADNNLFTSRPGGGATYFDQTGTLKLAPANTPRIDYGPIPGTYNWIHNSVLAGSVIGTIGSGGALPSTWALNSNSGLSTSVIGSGVVGGLQYVDIRIFGTSAGTFYVCAFDNNSATLGQPGQVWTESVYMALVSGSMANVNAVSVDLRMNSAFDQIVTLTSLLTRFYDTATNGGTNTVITPAFALGFANGVAIDITIRFAAPQLELSSFAGPYIATSGNPAGSFATNWIPNSTMIGAVVGTPGILPTGWSVSGVSGIAFNVVGLSTVGGFACIDIQVVGTPASTTTTDLIFTGINVAQYVTWIESVYTALVNGAMTNLTAIAIIAGSGGVQGPINTSSATLTRGSTAAANVPQTAFSPAIRFGFTSGQAVNVTLRIAAPQFEMASTPSVFVPTSGAIATVGATSLGLLVEEARTNSIANPRAEGATPGTPGTLPTGWSQANSSGLAFNVVGVGSENGIPFIDLSVIGTSTGTGVTNVVPIAATVAAAVSGQTWTNSYYVRVVAGSLTNIASVTLILLENSAGGAGLASTNQVITPTGAILATQRIAVTRLLNNVSTAFVSSTFSLNINTGLAINCTFRIGAPQLELGTTASTPILPAIGTPAATTRAQDLNSLAFTSVDSPSRSFMIEGYKFALSGPANSFQLASNSGNQTIRSFFRNNGTEPALAMEGTATATVDQGGSNIGTVWKLAASLNGSTNLVASMNGAAPNTGAVTGTVETAWSSVSFGSDLGGGGPWNGYIRRFKYWGRAMSSAELMRVST